MLHRIFIAINLPEEVKRELVNWQKRFSKLPCRWTKPENLHITLLFLGNLDDNQLLQTIEAVKSVIKQYQSFPLTLNRICYGPSDKNPPRMIWVEGKAPNKLFSLQKDLENTIFELPSYQYKQKENREYHLHLTLGRLKSWEFKRIETRPKIDEKIDLSFEVSSIEVMESKLKRTGPEYTILESILFPA